MIKRIIYDLKLLYNKHNIVWFLSVSLGILLCFSLFYYFILTQNDKIDYTDQIKNIKNSYFSYLNNRFGYNRKFLTQVAQIDPIIVITNNIFQVFIPFLMFIYFATTITREMESGVYFRYSLLLGRQKYFFLRLVSHGGIVILALGLFQFLMILLAHNVFLPVNMDRQWPIAFKSIIVNMLFMTILFEIILINSLMQKKGKRAFIVGTLLIWINIILLGSPLKVLSPYFYRDWIYHPNGGVFYVQVVIFVFFILFLNILSYFYLKKSNMYLKREFLKW